jgi:predicted transposase/invertase (TIGR01784 family)
MGKIIIPQRHDSYIKNILSDISLAKSLMESHLPKSIVKRLDWDSVQLTNKSFVSEELKQLHSDVVYKCTLDKQQGYLYYLVEHQSTPDKWLPVRLAEYNIQLMIQHINQGHKTLPIIVNEIIYAGTKSPYNEPIDIFDLFENPALAREIMQQPPKLTDLTIKTQEELLQEGRAGLFEVLMKQGIQRDEISWETWIKDNITVFHSIISETFGLESISYILATENVDDYEKILNFIKNIAPDKEELIMTAALQIEQKG